MVFTIAVVNFREISLLKNFILPQSAQSMHKGHEVIAFFVLNYFEDFVVIPRSVLLDYDKKLSTA